MNHLDLFSEACAGVTGKPRNDMRELLLRRAPQVFGPLQDAPPIPEPELQALRAHFSSAQGKQAILAWMVDGFRDGFTAGLPHPTVRPPRDTP